MSMGSPNQIALPGWFIKFIGGAEVLGAIGLILPRLLRIRPGLTPLAATGLVIIMIGATSVTWFADGLAPASFPMAVGLLAGFVTYGRSSDRCQCTRFDTPCHFRHERASVQICVSSGTSISVAVFFCLPMS